MTKRKTIEHAIERLYGPCPVGDFMLANQWASHLDWELVKQNVDAENLDFEWGTEPTHEVTSAEALIIDVRREMLHRAGEGEES
ncbi:MAG: hypothetical protein J5I93_11370 [Pirellulaceae bacterium]|nr:hypothetical protein [Pirellulaceae bacterium]